MGPSEMESSSNPEIPPHFLPKDENTSPDLLLPDNHKKIAGVNGAITSVPLRSSPRHFPPNGNPSMRGFQRGSFPIPFQPVKTPYNGMPDAYSGSEIPNINPTMGGSGIQVIITSPPPPSPTPHHLHHPHHPHHPPTPVNYIPEVDENGNFSGNSSMLPPIPLNPNDKNILSPPLNYNNSSRVGNNTLLDGEILSKMVNGTDDGAFLNDTHTQYLFRGVPYFRRMCKCLSDRVPPFKPADNLNETTTNFENGTLISNNSTICRCDLIRHDMLKYHHQNDTYPPPPYHHHNHTCLHCNSTKFLNKTSHEVRHFHNCSLDKVSHPDLEINEITINNSTNRNKTNLDDLGNERNGNFSNETAVQPIEPFPFYGVSNDTDNKFNHKYITNSTVVSSSEYTTTVVTTVYNISQNEAIKSQLFTIDSNLTNDYTKRSLKTLNINDTNNEIDKINNINNNSSADIQLTSPVFTLIADDISYCGNNTNHLKNIASNFRSVVGKLFNINSNDVLIIEMTPTNINVDCNNKSGNEDGKSGVRFTFM
ncbi:hypothetical protein FG379_002206 [Cryptosporidium bovis]|uniref:uncharacterized protein n=1 Tax=Cryptosporidium bovis TaxID=310047 RepID=UPI00351A491C|nr:hypothetical protein FG379_002206 [Cryptosporidium bovis]